MGIVYRAGMPPNELPEILIAAFDGDADLLRWTMELRPSWVKYLGIWVMEPKSEEARLRRADQVAERLLLTMEGERELPPPFARRLRSTRDAMAGWERMTLAGRRQHLLLLYGSRNPETQERYFVKLVEACVAKGRKAGEVR